MNNAARYLVRGAMRSDEDGLLRVAAFLDSVNLPNDRAVIRDVLGHSEDSFSGAVEDPRARQYVFVLEDLEEARIVGSAMVIGQKGRKEAPYIYLRVKKDEKYSPHLDRHFIHQVLELGFSYAGPSELGGLVVDPSYRRRPEKLGRLISYSRFLFIAAHREHFQDELLAELMPPLEPDGTSHLWEAIGRHFTGLRYQEADKLSKYNKEFIRRLFPAEDIYASLLSQEAQGVIGQVGEQTRGVEKMLRRIGFRYVNRVDPFDGGPHFMAKTDEVTLVGTSEEVQTTQVPKVDHSESYLLATVSTEPPWFQACLVSGSLITDGHEPPTLQVESPVAAVFSKTKGWSLPV